MEIGKELLALPICFVLTSRFATLSTHPHCMCNSSCLDGPLANPLKIKTVTEGEHVAIPCLKDNGNPPAVVTWYKGNDTSGNETTNSSVLEFQNAAPSNEGWYTCFAKSDVRNASATFFLNVGKFCGFSTINKLVFELCD